jgi:hypothetical protein
MGESPGAVPEKQVLKIPIPLRVIKEAGGFSGASAHRFTTKKKTRLFWETGLLIFSFLENLSATRLLMRQ